MYIESVQVKNFRNYDSLELTFDKGTNIQWKKDSLFHGLGLRNIKNAVERCGGDMSIHMGEGVFALSVILP